jgi:hypothetical protein
VVGVVDRFGTWSEAGGTLTFEEQLRIVRRIADPKKHASYLACTGYWDGSLEGSFSKPSGTRGGPVLGVRPWFRL